MKIPQYVISALRGSEIYYGKDGVIGYSFKVYKRTIYEYAQTLRNRCWQLITWVNKQEGGHAELVFCPKETHYCRQFAVVTIFDPVMIHLEKYIKG